MIIKTEMMQDGSQHNELCKCLREISVGLSELSKNQRIPPNKPEISDTTIGGRVAELEIKMSKLWGLLTSETPAGNTKLTKYGKMFQQRMS